MFKKLLLYILIVLGILFGMGIIFKQQEILHWYKLNFGEPDHRKVVAIAKQSNGQVNYKLPKKLIYNPLSNGTGLRYGDTISTDENSSVIIAFTTGFEILLGENSILILEAPSQTDDGQIVLSFLQGNYRVLKKSRTTKVMIKKDNHFFDPYKKLEKKIILTKPSATPTPTPVPTPTPIKIISKDKLEEIRRKIREDKKEAKKRQEKETLPDDYISAQIKKQRSLLFRCYIQHLRLNPNVTGRLNLRINIQPSGKVSNVMIVKSSINDPTLQQCVMNVVQRIKFKSYKGDPTIVNYPINFE